MRPLATGPLWWLPPSHWEIQSPFSSLCIYGQTVNTPFQMFRYEIQKVWYFWGWTFYFIFIWSLPERYPNCQILTYSLCPLKYFFLLFKYVPRKLPIRTISLSAALEIHKPTSHSDLPITVTTFFQDRISLSNNCRKIDGESMSVLHRNCWEVHIPCPQNFPWPKGWIFLVLVDQGCNATKCNSKSFWDW